MAWDFEAQQRERAEHEKNQRSLARAAVERIVVNIYTDRIEALIRRLHTPLDPYPSADPLREPIESFIRSAQSLLAAFAKKPDEESVLPLPDEWTKEVAK